MKILALIFWIIFFLLFCFAEVKVNDLPATKISERVCACGICALILTAMFGLPILGIIYLVGGLV